MQTPVVRRAGRSLSAHLLGFREPASRGTSQPPANPGEYEGRYEAKLEHLTVTVSGRDLRIEGSLPPKWRVDPPLVPLRLPAAELKFTDVDRAAVLSGTRRGERVEFLHDADGRIEWLR
jgi:hypothetical protein